MVATPLRSFQEIRSEWEGLLALSPVNNLFLTPQWQETWWDAFGNGRGLAGFYLRTSEGLMGVASLARQGNTLSFVGNRDTFDYNDFMIRPGYEPTFFPALLGSLEEQGCDTLELCSLIDSSPTLVHLPELARRRGYAVEITQEDVVPGLALPTTWEEYLDRLSRKDRHELRRKLRRLESVRDQGWYCLTDVEQVSARFGDFIALMRQSRDAKAQYLTPEREAFFHRIAERTARSGLLRLFFLELDGRPVATVLSFDYGPSRLLYNSGYYPEYSHYSVGLLLKALCLRHAIEAGQRYFDFLRGSEPYKYHLGAQDRILYQLVLRRS